MKIGYARVSTHEQNLDLQIDALKVAGCEKIFSDKITGTVAQRPELTKALEQLRSEDTFTVWRLDRLGRSLRDLIDRVSELERQGVTFESLKETLNTGTSSGKLVFHLFGALAEFERNLIKERTLAGLSAARSRGKKGGRPQALPEDKRKIAVDLYTKKELTVKQICEMLNIAKPTLYRYVKENQNS